MKIKTRMSLLFVVAAMLVTSGCVKLWRKSIDQKTYMLTTQREAEPIKTPLADKLWIDTVSVLPPFNIRSLILRDNDVQFETSYYSELLISPAENFRNNFYTWFAESGIFRHVSMSSFSDSSHKLSVSIVRFYGNLEEGDKKTVLSIKATLFDERADGMRVLFSKDYVHEEAIPNMTAEELIRSYNRSLTKILTTCEKDVVDILK
jgi:uncharacterized lipoprotein YmbA